MRAARRRPWPAMIPSMESTRIGFTNPNSTMDAAICATCSAEWVRAFLTYGTSRSVGQISMRRDIAGVMVTGSVAIGLGTKKNGHPFAPGCPVSRRLAPGWRLVHRLPQARLTATERATHASEIPPTDLSSLFHATTQSLSTWRKKPRVVTGMPSSSRPSTRRSFQQRRPLSRFSGKLYRVPDGGCVSTGLLPSCRRDQIAFKCPLRPYEACTNPPATSCRAASSERKPSEVPSDA